jgi:hypothetical protein
VIPRTLDALRSAVARRTEVRAWRLPGGHVVRVALPLPLTPRDVDHLRRYLDVLTAEASIAWDDVPVGVVDDAPEDAALTAARAVEAGE